MRLLICCAILLLVCAFAQVQGDCEYKNGDTLSVGEHYRDCMKIICREDGTIGAISCPLLHCVNQIGYQEKDITKPYPECCERPICKD